MRVSSHLFKDSGRDVITRHLEGQTDRQIITVILLYLPSNTLWGTQEWDNILSKHTIKNTENSDIDFDIVKMQLACNQNTKTLDVRFLPIKKRPRIIFSQTMCNISMTLQ